MAITFHCKFHYKITVKSFIFVGLKFCGFEFNNEFVDIYFRCFLMCSQKPKIICLYSIPKH